jgi:hypothetical protein
MVRALEFRIGKTLIEGLQMVVELLPPGAGGQNQPGTLPLVRPQPAYVYAIPRGCRFTF